MAGIDSDVLNSVKVSEPRKRTVGALPGNCQQQGVCQYQNVQKLQINIDREQSVEPIKLGHGGCYISREMKPIFGIGTCCKQRLKRTYTSWGPRRKRTKRVHGEQLYLVVLLLVFFLFTYQVPVI